jgi:P4 family phage/plasmid primase-like protien
MTDKVMPYYDAAHRYLDAGWWPIYLNEEKHGLPKGYTGYNGRAVTRTEVDEWARKFPSANVALRLPRDVVALDVDHYGDKRGADSLAALVDKYGPLPPTLVATARDLPSGKYLFKVPVGTQLVSTPGPSIETLQFHHRYVVAWPSRHHSGATVRWIDEASGEVLDRVPEFDDLPDLPWSWLEGLSESGSGCVADAATEEEVRAWIDRCTANRAPRWLDHLIAKAEWKAPANRHDTIYKALCDITREAEIGAYPAQEALERLHKVYEANNHGNDDSFEGMVGWAVGQLNAEDADERLERARERLERYTDPTKGLLITATATSSITVPAAIDDSNMAAAFADTLQGGYLYVASWRRWHRWDGRRWADDDTEAIHEKARRWVLDLGAHLLEAGAPAAVVGSVAGYRSRSKLDALVTLARRMDGIAARADEFDRHPTLLNVANGVIDLTTGELRDHDPALRLRKLADTHYDPDATHPDVDAVVAVVEDDVRTWVQRLAGYAATGETIEDIVPVFDGAGANGKTTLLEACAAALGDYAGAAPAKLIMRTSNDEHPTIKADLLGRRLVWISETEEGGSLRMEQLKSLTGGDRIKARFMRADYFEFQPTHTLIVATNHRPRVNSTEHAAWRRLRLVPFPHTYRSPEDAQPGDRVRDARLRNRLKSPRQRSAMLAWIVTGAVDWHDHGLGECDTITAATTAWRRSEDYIARFIDDRLDLGGDGNTRGRALYAAYREWCDEEGRPAKSNKNFTEDFLTHDEVTNAGVDVVRPQNVAHYRRVQIRASTGI